MKLNKKMFDLGTTILASKEKNPDAIAIAGIDYKYTYYEWFKKIDTLSGSLKYLGLKKQEKGLKEEKEAKMNLSGKLFI